MKRPATSAKDVKQATPSPSGTWAKAAIWASATWVLGVASIKLFKGSPSDLPLMVQNFVEGLDIGLKFQLVVGIELSVVFLAYLRPRWGWPLLVGMFSLFVAMLAKMISDGVTSCGCFGGAIKIEPPAMLAIDGACLLAILATRPWSSLPKAPVRRPLLLAALAVAWIAPFVAFDNTQLPTTPPPAVPAGTTPPANGAAPGDPTAAAPQRPPWKLPDTLPTFQVLNPAKQEWQGKDLRDTPVGALVDVELYPLDATWILYRITCDHCAKEFREIALDPERAAKLYVLVKIPEQDEEKYRQVDVLPPVHQQVDLPPLPKGYVGQTPWTLEVAGGVITQVIAGEGIDTGEKPK